MEIELTLDADYMICVLYDEHLRRIKNGIPPDDAIFFGNCEQIQELVPQFTTHEITFILKDLSSKNLMSAFYPENQLEDCALNHSGILYMEKRFGKKLSTLTDKILKLKSAITLS